MSTSSNRYPNVVQLTATPTPVVAQDVVLFPYAPASGSGWAGLTPDAMRSIVGSGEQGPQGPQGAAGPQGVQGQQGQQGPPGVSNKPIFQTMFWSPQNNPISGTTASINSQYQQFTVGVGCTIMLQLFITYRQGDINAGITNFALAISSTPPVTLPGATFNVTNPVAANVDYVSMASWSWQNNGSTPVALDVDGVINKNVTEGRILIPVGANVTLSASVSV